MVRAVGTIRQRVYRVISKSTDGDTASRVFDGLIVVLILLSVLSIILQSFDALDRRFAGIFSAFETLSVAVFTAEYIARVWTARLAYPDSKHPVLRYIFSGMAIIDLLAILPFYLPYTGIDLRFLRMVRLVRITRMLRLLRVAKLGRYLSGLKTITTVIKETKAQLFVTLGLCGAMLLFSAILIYSVENPAQPGAFPNVLAALWWAVCTLTTVGYGDVYPVTAFGKVLASFIAVVGIGIIAIPTGIISAGFMRVVNHEDTAEANEKHFCPYCGKKLEP